MRKDRDTNRPRGFAFITFTSPAAAKIAVESMHGGGKLLAHSDVVDLETID